VEDQARPATATEPVVLQRLHVASVLFHWFAVVRSGAVPLVLVALQSRTRGARWLLVGLAVLLGLYVLGSLARWLTTRYGLTGEALHVRSGVLGRQARVIPFRRIQSVHLRQSALQRLLGLGEVHVDTATQGAASEVVLRLLRWPEAQAMQAQLAALRAAALGEPTARPVRAPVAVAADRGEADAVAVPDPITVPARAASTHAASTHAASTHVANAGDVATPDIVVRVNTEQLMIAGGTSNNVGVLLALLISGCERVRSSFFDDLDITDGLVGSAATLVAALGGTWVIALVMLVVVVPLLVASWMVSVAGSVVRYHGFTLERAGANLRRRHGLLSRMEASVPVARAQALRFRQSLLRRPFGLGELHLVSAGSATAGAAGASGGHQLLLPILRQHELGRYVREVFPAARLLDVLEAPLTDARWRRPEAVAAVRIALTSTLRLALLIGAVAVVSSTWALRLAWLVPVVWGLAVVRQRARGIAIADGHVLVREGGVARDTVLLPEQKLQLIEVRQGPVQRLFGLGTLRLTTAGIGGDADVVDLPIATVRALQAELTSRLSEAARPAETSPPSPARAPSASAPSFLPEMLPHGA
jgi:putative membrane protein